MRELRATKFQNLYDDLFKKTYQFREEYNDVVLENMRLQTNLDLMENENHKEV